MASDEFSGLVSVLLVEVKKENSMFMFTKTQKEKASMLEKAKKDEHGRKNHTIFFGIVMLIDLMETMRLKL